MVYHCYSRVSTFTIWKTIKNNFLDFPVPIEAILVIIRKGWQRQDCHHRKPHVSYGFSP